MTSDSTPDKVAVVTGASSGIGAATARPLVVVGAAHVVPVMTFLLRLRLACAGWRFEPNAAAGADHELVGGEPDAVVRPRLRMVRSAPRSHCKIRPGRSHSQVSAVLGAPRWWVTSNGRRSAG